MAQALITINGTVGSNDDLPINVSVLLSNVDSGGEDFYFWEILDQPPGPADAITPNNIKSPSFTPKKEGSYLIQLTVNNNVDLANRAIAAVRFLKTRERAPAAQEQTEVDTTKGWGDATNDWFSRLDNFIADPGVIVGVAEGALVVGNIVRLSPVSGFSVLKSGLPGEEIVPRFSLVSGDDLYTGPVFLFIGTASGSTTAISGDVVRARLFGMYFTTLPFGVSVGDTLYVRPDGEFRQDVTTIDAPRPVAFVVGEVSLGVYALYYNGLMATSAAIDLVSANTGSLGPAPANTIRLVNDSSVLKVSVDGSAYTPISSGVDTEFDLGMYFLGQPLSGEVVLRYTFNQDIEFPVGFAGSHGTAEDIATVTDMEFSVVKDDGVTETTIGAVLFGPGDLNATFDLPVAVTFFTGETIKLVLTTAVPDPTLSGLAINLKGTKL